MTFNKAKCYKDAMEVIGRLSPVAIMGHTAWGHHCETPCDECKKKAMEVKHAN